MVTQYRNIKPLIIGMGLAGSRHLEAQLKLGVKTGIYNINPESTKPFSKNPNVIIFENLELALNWCNLVHICTPDDKHAEYVTVALKRKKAVLCEKSFTTNLKDALYLQNLAHQYDSTLIVGQNYRLTPTFLETKKKVFQGQLGKINHIETTYFHDNSDYKKRYPNVNFLYMGGSHAVDLACWIIDEPAVNIQATSQNPLVYEIKLIFASGLEGQIKLDASSPRIRSGTDLKVFGEKGKSISHNKDKKNINVFTTPLEVKIVNDYLLNKSNSYWPLPGVDEAVNVIKVLDAVSKAVSL